MVFVFLSARRTKRSSNRKTRSKRTTSSKRGNVYSWRALLVCVVNSLWFFVQERYLKRQDLWPEVTTFLMRLWERWKFTSRMYKTEENEPSLKVSQLFGPLFLLALAYNGQVYVVIVSCIISLFHGTCRCFTHWHFCSFAINLLFSLL